MPSDTDRAHAYLVALGAGEPDQDAVLGLAALLHAVRGGERQAVAASLGRLATRDWLAASAATALAVAAGLVERGEFAQEAGP